MSLTQTEPQFECFTAYPSNLDRCNRCGAPRSVHGADWSCAVELPGRPHIPLFVAGGLLGLAGDALWITSGAASTALATLGVLGFLVGLTVTIAAFIIAGRQG
jgi:hypothetical protein